LTKSFDFLILNLRKDSNIELFIFKVSPNKDFINKQLKLDNNQKIIVKPFDTPKTSPQSLKTNPKITVKSKLGNKTKVRSKKPINASKSVDYLNERIKLNEANALSDESLNTSKYQIIEPLETSFDLKEKKNFDAKKSKKIKYSKFLNKKLNLSEKINFENKTFENKTETGANFKTVPPKIDLDRPNR
jgi:hypothetical protein